LIAAKIPKTINAIFIGDHPSFLGLLVRDRMQMRLLEIATWSLKIGNPTHVESSEGPGPAAGREAHEHRAQTKALGVAAARMIH
jgi:hypothetical protein